MLVTLGEFIVLFFIVFFIVRIISSINPKYKQKRKELGAKINGTLKHVSGLPIPEETEVEMFICPDKFVFIGDNKQITIDINKINKIDRSGVNLIIFYTTDNGNYSIVLNGKGNTRFIKKVMKHFNWGYGSTTIPSEIDL